MLNNPHLPVQVVVSDCEGKPVAHARVTMESAGGAGGKHHGLEFQPRQRCHIAFDIDPGPYFLRAEASGYAGDERLVRVHQTGLQTVLVLGPPGLPFFYRGEVKIPFQPYPDLLAVVLASSEAKQAERRIFAIARRQELTPVVVGEGVSRQRVFVFRFALDTAKTARERTQHELTGVHGVNAVGPLIRFYRDGVSLLTDELVVKFNDQVSLACVIEIADRFGMEKLRGLPQAGNAFLLRIPGLVTYETLDVAMKFVTTGLVEYAEPNLISIVAHDAVASTSIHPQDFLFPMQWHLPLINCPQAWRALHDNISPDCAMGSPDINIAVVDWGIDVGNPEFAGSVSDGRPKVSQVFDFQNMVPNNDERARGHGTCCAGVATALPNNEGVCGAAGNCRLMAIRRPDGDMGKETSYSDMYLWIGGFGPKSSVDRFPLPISRGADVISNSFGYSAGLPISGLMKDTFDFLTTHGRNGRGILLFFSVGNDTPPKDFTLERPWAAYDRTFAVAASSLANDGISEIRAKDSNFGGTSAQIDFCAPSANWRGAPYDPPKSYAIVTAADRTFPDDDPNLRPNAPSRCTAKTTTTGPSATGATSLTLVDTAGFVVDQFLIVGTPGSTGTEFSQITGIPDGTRLDVKPLSEPHPSGTLVSAGPSCSLHTFSGTSCATALAAGVGALLLSANPELTWLEVRDILRETAVPIDTTNTDPIGIWRDVNGVASNVDGYAGPHYSRWYGFGRINAEAAVQKAIGLRGATPSATT
jgi:subtilisin family serine protease